MILFAVLGCARFLDQPVQSDEFTKVFPQKMDNALVGELFLYRKIDKASGEPIGEGHIFTRMEKSRIQTKLLLKKDDLLENKTALVHFDWIGPDGKSFYIKQVELLITDSSMEALSSISLSPETRDEGQYKLHVYLFRERILEKSFSVVSAFQSDEINPDDFVESITLYRKKGRKTGKLIGVDSVFSRKEKRKVRALVKLIDHPDDILRERRYRLEWIGPGGKSIFKKRIDLQANDSSSLLSSSFSIGPEKRIAGNYVLRLYLFDKLLVDSPFILQ